ncbi:ABC transporter permease [Desnuesiella massiliensis]|uniref:ABC transporter permease n=1 Tax=Desnuesiella massiliensis TaxID=1650662 RepID=UPI0006E44E8A|nr:ABC transporter permease subunit [Desnuesiella massiliensis]
MKDYFCTNKKYSLISIVMILVIWQVGAIVINNEIIVPKIETTLLSLGEIVNKGDIILVISSTLLRSFLSFLISLFFAVMLGVLGGLFEKFHYMLLPLLSVFKSLPTMGIIILALIWLDTDKAPIFIGFIITFPILYGSIVTSIKNMDTNLINMCKVYKVSKAAIVKEVYIPHIYYYVADTFATVLGLTIKVVIAGEVVGQAKNSIGGYIQLEKVYLNTSGVFAWMIIVVLLNFLIDLVLNSIISHTVKWK